MDVGGCQLAEPFRHGHVGFLVGNPSHAGRKVVLDFRHIHFLNTDRKAGEVRVNAWDTKDETSGTNDKERECVFHFLLIIPYLL